MREQFQSPAATPTLRDYFAAAALTGLLPQFFTQANDDNVPIQDALYEANIDGNCRAAARNAYRLADCMMKQRGKPSAIGDPETRPAEASPPAAADNAEITF